MLRSAETSAGAAIATSRTNAILRRALVVTAGLALFLTALALGVALVNHDPANAASPTGLLGSAARLLGRHGREAAAALYGAMGMTAWIAVLLAAGWGWRLATGRMRCHPGVVLMAIPLTLIFGAVSFAALWSLPHWPLQNGLGGGLLGDVMYGRLVPTISWLTGVERHGAGVLTGLASALVLPYALGSTLGLRDAVGQQVGAMVRGVAWARADGPADRQDPPEAAAPSAAETNGRRAARNGARKTARQALSDLGLAGAYALPPLGLLAETTPRAAAQAESDAAVATERARRLEAALAEFGVEGGVVDIKPGPVVTLYEFEPAAGIKASRVIGLADDIARSMSATSARVAVIPGRKAMGIEIPNEVREIVGLRELLEHPAFGQTGHDLAMALGKDIGGAPVVQDLTAMPHLLIAGTTGSGKSVGINTLILSILYRMTPDACRFIMIDPKMLELTVYDGIPHLLTPVVTDPDEAVTALNWTVGEMEARYKAMSALGARNIAGYNGRLAELRDQPAEDEPGTETEAPSPLPHIVIVIDEIADLVLTAGKEFESAVQRIAQMARAAGIHLVMATQRPSADVITGTIKANFPSRISFQVASKIDSRTVLGESGAEQLLGKGDMLFMAGGGKLTRVHGAFVSEAEVEAVADFLRAQGEPAYVAAVTGGAGEAASG